MRINARARTRIHARALVSIYCYTWFFLNLDYAQRDRPPSFVHCARVYTFLYELWGKKKKKFRIKYSKEHNILLLLRYLLSPCTYMGWRTGAFTRRSISCPWQQLLLLIREARPGDSTRYRVHIIFRLEHGENPSSSALGLVGEFIIMWKKKNPSEV